MSHHLSTSAKHPFSLVAWADDSWTTFVDRIFHPERNPLSNLAKTAALSLMQRIVRGHLRVTTTDVVYQFPTLHGPNPLISDDEPKAELRVINDTFWFRLFAMGDLGFGEAYMYGDVECNDLVSFFKIFISNRQSLSGIDSFTSFLFRIPRKLTSWRFFGSLSNSRSNISAHYDISNAMFAGFLSKDMTYSCAIFESLDADLVPDYQDQRSPPGSCGQLLPSSVETRDELYEAQLRKLNLIISKAKISSGQRILEIGTGWGSMAILIAQRFPNTTVDTITLSDQQQSLAQARIKEAGLEDRITVHLMDYRTMPGYWQSSFDRVISIEMIENVGIEFLVDYWRVVDWAMKKEDSVGVVQVTTIPEARFEKYAQEIDFIQKWVFFPGGALPSLTTLLRTMEAGSSGCLLVDSVCNIGPHYARTLREWRRRFVDNFDSTITPALKAEHPEVMNGARGAEEIEVFKRKWLYYFCYCEAGFATRVLGDHIIAFTREGSKYYG